MRLPNLLTAVVPESCRIRQSQKVAVISMGFSRLTPTKVVLIERLHVFWAVIGA